MQLSVTSSIKGVHNSNGDTHSASHISATIPSITEPPAVDRPPSARNARMVPKFGATPTGICQMFTKNKLSWRIGHLPSSSLQGYAMSVP